MFDNDILNNPLMQWLLTIFKSIALWIWDVKWFIIGFIVFYILIVYLNEKAWDFTSEKLAKK